MIGILALAFWLLAVALAWRLGRATLEPGDPMPVGAAFVGAFACALVLSAMEFRCGAMNCQ